MRTDLEKQWQESKELAKVSLCIDVLFVCNLCLHLFAAFKIVLFTVVKYMYIIFVEIC